MDDKQLALFIIAIFILVVPLSLGLALWLVTRLRRTSDQPLSDAGDGAILVPVRGLTRRYRLLGHAQNSINPRLEIVDDGLRFKLFKPDHWRFAELTEVDAPWSPFVTRLVIRHRTEGQLYVDLADKARAGDFLRALPRDMALTERAIGIRDNAS